MTGEWSLSMTLTIYDQPPRYSGEMVPNAPPAGNPAETPRATSDVPAMIETLSLNRGLAGYRAPRAALLTTRSHRSFDGNTSSSAEPSTSPTKGPVPGMLTAFETSGVGVQAFTAVETSLQTFNTAANSPIANAALADTATSNSLEEGFVALDDVSRLRRGLEPRRRITRDSKPWEALNWIRGVG